MGYFMVFLSFSSFKKKKKNVEFQGLPWWLSGKETSCRCRRHGFDPWSGKISHATQQLSPYATSIELVP